LTGYLPAHEGNPVHVTVVDELIARAVLSSGMGDGSWHGVEEGEMPASLRHSSSSS